MNNYYFNSDYVLWHDEKRTYIIEKYQNNDSSRGWISVIHPVQAMILSFFTQVKPYEEILADLKAFLETDLNSVKKIIKPFLSNGSVYTDYHGEQFHFPQNVLLKESANNMQKLPKYSAEDFMFSETDFKSKRYYSSPLNVTLMPSNNCVTNCIYCYADRQTKSTTMPFERIKGIIDEAKELGVLHFGMVGGEIFAYPQWNELIRYIKQNDFVVDRLSTKVPLSKEDVINLKEAGIRQMQISLDTLVPKTLSKILRVNESYTEKIKNTVRYFCEEGFDTTIASVVTTDNCDMENMLSIYEFLKDIKVTSWGLRPAFPSIYKNNSSSFTPTGEQIYKLFDEVEEQLQKRSTFPITYDKAFLERGYNESKGGSTNFKGAECSANRSHIFILPDGKVTICEQLYWKPHFIIGDLSKQTIKEVWHSERAMWFANLDTPQLQEGNPCKDCGIFAACYKNMNRCWAEVVKAYGDEYWDYPDPRCEFAPPHKVNNLIY
ncbi:MAG: radical SAM protein [Prevotellaceae bacterium]|jgi:radical SAM protein with 4Fe4S-binding SPASM domain|nr:radical SAM protein [Prevotellaceae bacterium]